MKNLEKKITQALENARADERGRYAKVVVSDGPLRQTVLALVKGGQLAEHNSPPAASLLLFTGRLTVTAQEDTEITAGELVELTHFRHSVTAQEDSVFLLTTVTSQPDTDSHDGLPE
ncbi:cupin [Corynebacterium sp.]|uniref:cupin n=1 Tax=Corynebacterium sp. TaxID=1720 RepID=UPI003735A0AD